MKNKFIAVLSIGLMLIASSAVLFDRLIFAYLITIVYAVVRWNFAEMQRVEVKSITAKWLLKIFIVICALLFAASGGFHQNALAPVFAFLGFVFAYNIGRYFNKVNFASNEEIKSDN